MNTKSYIRSYKRGYGNSYDPPFFEGIDFSREAIREADEELRAYRKNKKVETEEYWRHKREEENRPLAEKDKTSDNESINWLGIGVWLYNRFLKK